MIYVFTQVFHEPLTLQPKAHFCDLCLYKRTFYKSFKSFSVITAKHETDNWVDSAVRASRIKGDFIVYPETTREMRESVLIPYD